MYGMNPNYTIVTREQHQADIRRAAEFHLAREARRLNGGQRWLPRLYGRFTSNSEATRDANAEQAPQTIV